MKTIYFLDSLRVTTSIYPVPSICAQDQISDWFASLAECLHWNVRKKQKHFDELSDLTRYGIINPKLLVGFVWLVCWLDNQVSPSL